MSAGPPTQQTTPLRANQLGLLVEEESFGEQYTAAIFRYMLSRDIVCQDRLGIGLAIEIGPTGFEDNSVEELVFAS